MATKMISVRVDTEDLKRYKKLANYRRLNFTAWVVEALESRAREDERAFHDWERFLEFKRMNEARDAELRRLREEQEKAGR